MATKSKLDGEVDALFQLPLAEFTGARNTLSAQLKKAGRAQDAENVKRLAKPPISAWAVNQLYWQHRDQFEQLIAAGQRFRRAQTTARAGKMSELNEALNSRRETLNKLSEKAASLLQNEGHNPTLEIMRRIATTLEAMSAYVALPDGQTAGRLTRDVDPPGFESLAPFIRVVSTAPRAVPAPVASPGKAVGAPARTKQAPTAKKEAGGDRERHKAVLANAKASLQSAKKALVAARSKAQDLAAAHKKANREAELAEKHKREAEMRFKQASVASTEAAVRVQNLAREAERASKAIDDAERAVERAAKELDLLVE